MTTTQAALLEALTKLLAHAERANEIMLHEAGIGVVDLSALEEARAIISGTKSVDAALSAAEAAQPEPVAYLARSRYGSQCHFGMKAAADAWAGDGGEVFEIPLWHLGLVSPSLAQPAPIAAQAGDSEVRRVFDLLPTALRAHPGIKALRDAKVRAAQAGPAKAPLTDEQIDKLMREIGRKIEGHILVPGVPMHGDWPVYYRAKVRAAIAIAAQAPLTRQQIDEVMTEHYPLSSLLREEVDAFEACVRDIERRLGIGAQAPASTRPADASAHELAELVLAMDMVTPRGLVARQLARNILGVQGGDNLPPMTAIVTNGTLRILYRNEPVFLLRAQDELAARAVEFYAGLCAVEAPEVCQRALDHAKLMRAWPTKKLPDLPPAGGAAR